MASTSEPPGVSAVFPPIGQQLAEAFDPSRRIGQQLAEAFDPSRRIGQQLAEAFDPRRRIGQELAEAFGQSRRIGQQLAEAFGEQFGQTIADFVAASTAQQTGSVTADQPWSRSPANAPS